MKGKTTEEAYCEALTRALLKARPDRQQTGWYVWLGDSVGADERSVYRWLTEPSANGPGGLGLLNLMGVLGPDFANKLLSLVGLHCVAEGNRLDLTEGERRELAERLRTAAAALERSEQSKRPRGDANVTTLETKGKVS